MSRLISDLRPEMQEAVILLMDSAKQKGLDLLITCTLRTAKEQADLYVSGRNHLAVSLKAAELLEVYNRPDLAALLTERPASTGVGRIVTMAGPGQSLHQYGAAMDCVPMVAGKPMWEYKSPLWKLYGEAVREAGLEWAGDWQRFTEFPHCELKGLNWKELIRGNT